MNGQTNGTSLGWMECYSAIKWNSAWMGDKVKMWVNLKCILEYCRYQSQETAYCDSIYMTFCKRQKYRYIQYMSLVIRGVSGREVAGRNSEAMQLFCSIYSDGHTILYSAQSQKNYT